VFGCGPVERGQGALGQPHGPAVHALQQPLPLEKAQIPPNGLRSDAKIAGEIGDLHPTVCVEPTQDPAMPISCGVHLHRHRFPSAVSQQLQ
jgi:hypothetical protein